MFGEVIVNDIIPTTPMDVEFLLEFTTFIQYKFIPVALDWRCFMLPLIIP